MSLRTQLDVQADRIRNGQGAEAVAELCDLLRDIRKEVLVETWVSDIVPECRAHPIHDLLLNDPYTHRAYFKPRGYAGDAAMLDFIYSGIPPKGTSQIGQAVFQGTTRLSNGRSVIARCDLLASRIDEIAASRSGANILSLACGHLREAQKSRYVSAGRVVRFFAFDQDAESLAVVQREQGALGVQAVQGSVIAIIRKRLAFADLDFVYAAGLLDYLSDELSRRLAAVMFSMLRRGGRMLVANFTPDNHGLGYMECFMDWTLRYRDEGQMATLLDDISPRQLAASSLFRDDEANVVYLELTKA